MSKSVAAELQALELLANLPDVEAAVGSLKRAFASRTSSTVAKAASLVAKFKVHALASDLVAAFDHFMEAGEKADRLCSTKLAIVKALHATHCAERDLYTKGMRYYWPSRPRFGQRDQAADLRIACAEALADAGHLDLLMHLADLLGDPTPSVRVAAAQILSSTGERESRNLLRLKARCGDSAPEVTDACFAALLNHDAETAIPFIAEFLAAEDEGLRVMAVLALGQSGNEGALKHLTTYLRYLAIPEERNDTLVAIALLRKRPAVEFLLSLINDGGDDAEGAIRALSSFKADSQIKSQVEATVDRTGDPSLKRHFEASFRQR